MTREVAFAIRSSRTLGALVEHLRSRFGWPEFVTKDQTARLTFGEVSVALDWSPFQARRSTANVVVTVRAADRSVQAAFEELNERPAPSRFKDHFHFHSAMGFDALCSRVVDAFGLPPIRCEVETDNEWGMTEDDDRVVHVSRSFTDDLFSEWQPARCPRGCNYWVIVSIKAEAPQHWDGEWRRGWRDSWMRTLAPLGDKLTRT